MSSGHCSSPPMPGKHTSLDRNELTDVLLQVEELWSPIGASRAPNRSNSRLAESRAAVAEDQRDVLTLIAQHDKQIQWIRL